MCHHASEKRGHGGDDEENRRNQILPDRRNLHSIDRVGVKYDTIRVYVYMYINMSDCVVVWSIIDCCMES